MKNVKVLVSVIASADESKEATYCRCERVARFGIVEHQLIAYEPFFDEDVTILLVVRRWDENSHFPLYRIPVEMLRNALWNINLQIP